MFLPVSGARAAQPLGAVTQLSGTAGCFTYTGTSEDGPGTCTRARGLATGESVAISPDGANVYALTGSDKFIPLEAGVVLFSRNPSTGALTQLSGTAGCLTPDGSSAAGPGTCTEARGFQHPGDFHDLVFTSDGRWAYMGANNDPTTHGGVLIFQRDPATGALTQLAGAAGCITTDGSSQDGAGTCQTDSTLNDGTGLSMSSDDRFLYVTDRGAIPWRVHVFARNTSSGALSEVQCISEAPAPAGCAPGRVLGFVDTLALSPAGTHAYSGDGFHGLSVFDRDPTTGLLTQKAGTAGCITDDCKDDTSTSTCAVGRVLYGTTSMAMSPDGATLYDSGNLDHGFSAFHVNGDGTLNQLSGTGGCVTIDGKDNTGASTCAIGRAISNTGGLAISPDGATLYVGGTSSSTPSGGFGVFSLDPTTGVATQLSGLPGCVTGDGSSNGTGTAGQCTDGTALSQGGGLAVSPDGHSVYQATGDANTAGLAAFAREAGPACQATSVTTAAGGSMTVPLSCSDADGDAVTRSVVSGPTHGTLSAINNAAGTVTYTPAAGFAGKDSFTFAASDGVNSSGPANVAITVVAPALSKLSIHPHRFSLAGRRVNGRCVPATKANKRNKPCRRAIKLHVSYVLNASDVVTFTVERQVPGRKVRGRCVTPTSKNRRQPRCMRLVAVRGKLTRSSTEGTNRFIFNGKLGGHTLGAGTYVLIATPAAGKPRKAAFLIVA
jgi:hypothetical protein